jgi:hypothetical protein
MIIKCLCEHCSTELEFDAFEIPNQESAECPACHNITSIKKRPTPQPKQVYTAPNPVRERLLQIRKNSCYRALRGLISIVSAIFSGGAIFSGMIGVWIGIAQRNESCIVGSAVASVAMIFVVIALRQSALLMVDIADTLLIENSKVISN